MSVEKANELECRVFDETGFTPTERIFEGKIYDSDKIATRIYRGTQTIQGEPRHTILKIQFLKNADEEGDLMKAFATQNKSCAIRTAHIFQQADYNEVVGYGYMLMEEVQGEAIFSGLANERDREKWLKFFSDFKTTGLTKALFPPSLLENEATRVTALRLFNWLRITKRQHHLTLEKIRLTIRHLIKMTLDGVRETEFVHGHLSPDAIQVTPTGDHVVMSQAFYKYLPKLSDAVFQIWASLKDLRGDDILSPEQAVTYCEQWRSYYQALPCLANMENFEKYFASAMRERAAGALIVDIDSDLMNKQKEDLMTSEDAQKLKAMFRGIFNHY